MKVALFNGSPRKKGNTYTALSIVADELNKEGIAAEINQVGGKDIKACDACGICKKRADGYCAIKDDVVNEYIEKMYEAEGIVIGSPVYFGSLTPETKALVDRTGYSSRAGGFLLKRKACASVAAVRRAGSVDVLSQINNLFYLGESIIVCSSYWNMVVAKEIGDINKDSEGLEILKTLGQNMAWVLKKTAS